MWLYFDGVESEVWRDNAGPRTEAFFRDVARLDRCAFGQLGTEVLASRATDHLVDDYAVWDQPLSKAQVARLYSGVAPNLII